MNPENIFKNINSYNFLIEQSNLRVRENKKTILETHIGTKIAARHNIYDIKIIKEQFVDLQYFPKFIPSDFKPKVVLDIGGYIGDLSLYCASTFDSKVHCYEPTPQNYAMIQENINLNKDLNITVFNKGVSNSRQPITLGVQEISGEIHASSHKKYKSHVTTIEVPCVSLNDAIEELNEEKIDLVKIDCEGQEFEILKNVDSYELSGKINYLIFEYHSFVADYKNKLESILNNLEANFDILKRSKKLCFLKSKNV